MEYEIAENDEERRKEMRRFYEHYDAVRRKYGLMLSCHASVFDGCWVRIWQGSGMKKKLIIKVENENETLCYRVAAEALAGWVENKKACEDGEKREEADWWI